MQNNGNDYRPPACLSGLLSLSDQKLAPTGTLPHGTRDTVKDRQKLHNKAQNATNWLRTALRGNTNEKGGGAQMTL